MENKKSKKKQLEVKKRNKKGIMVLVIKICKFNAKYLAPIYKWEKSKIVMEIIYLLTMLF